MKIDDVELEPAGSAVRDLTPGSGAAEPATQTLGPALLKSVAGRSLREFRSENTPSGLLPAESALLEAMTTGALCWHVDEDHLSALLKGELWPLAKPDKERFGRNVRVRGEFLRMLALGCDSACGVHEKGITLVGAYIEGALDLSYCDVQCPLQFYGCWFEKSLIARGASLSVLDLSGSRIPGIDATEASFASSLSLTGCRCDGGFWINGAGIDGNLSFEGGRLARDGQGFSINGQSARIGRNVLLRNGFRATGQIWLQGSRIKGDLDCGGGKFENKTPHGLDVAVNVRHAKIDGSVRLGNMFTAAGGVSLRGIEIMGDLVCSGVHIVNRTADGQGLAVDATSARIKGNVFFGDGFRAEGQVSLHGCEVGGSVECGSVQPRSLGAHPGSRPKAWGACFINQRGKDRGFALNATSANIKANFVLLHGVRVLGQWSMAGAEIGGYFQSESGRFLNRTKDGQGVAFNAANAKVKQVHLGNGVRMLGQATFRGTDIDGDLDCGGIQVANRAEVGDDKGAGFAFDAGMAKIRGHLQLFDGRLYGQTSLQHAEIVGDLDCSRAHFINPTPDGQGTALNAAAAKIRSTAFLSSLQARGKVTLTGASIDGQLDCSGSHFSNPAPAKQQGKQRRRGELPRAELALELQEVKVGDRLFLGPPDNIPDAHVVIDGSLSLLGAYARQISDDHRSWPPKTIAGPAKTRLQTEISLEEFTYEVLDSLTPIELRKQWLRRRSPNAAGKVYSPQPFEQLAKVLRATGKEEDARVIALDKQAFRRESKEAPFGWGLYGFFVGYGYRPARLFGFLVVLWLACALVYGVAWHRNLFAPAQPAVFLSKDLQDCRPGKWNAPDCMGKMKEYPGFNPLIYSLEFMLPVLDLQQKRAWAPSGEQMAPPVLGMALPKAWALWMVVWLQTIVGWLGCLVLVAVLAGLVKKD